MPSSFRFTESNVFVTVGLPGAGGITVTHAALLPSPSVSPPMVTVLRTPPCGFSAEHCSGVRPSVNSFGARPVTATVYSFVAWPSSTRSRATG
ncbi:hypothetical protein CXF46_10440 [Corynebacterium bovis]|nr:hypothetical protein CXF38_09995 [Corynebacterium bovis]RRO83353.1 hypothetical protein CXF36_03310 [Corynebacterium bovis]RRO84513.1 hypothetical protein CXF37_03065 [Corynebacterium bovis]RRO91673.1 hypothetical protein CXF45_03190 [Corynebacterium bovis]RRO95044.1 hypothetical protein CXF29_05820 [Corynebacterium bovis]